MITDLRGFLKAVIYSFPGPGKPTATQNAKPTSARVGESKPVLLSLLFIADVRNLLGYEETQFSFPAFDPFGVGRSLFGKLLQNKLSHFRSLEFV